jgi:hypothetical protein
VAVRSPDISHPLPIAWATDEELVIPPRSTATAKGTLRHSDVLRWPAVVLPHGDETFRKKKEQGCKDGLILSGEFPSFQEVVIVIAGSDKGINTHILERVGSHIREVGLTPPGDSIRLATEE